MSEAKGGQSSRALGGGGGTHEMEQSEYFKAENVISLEPWERDWNEDNIFII